MEEVAKVEPLDSRYSVPPNQQKLEVVKWGNLNVKVLDRGVNCHARSTRLSLTLIG